ncbi:hypothetical protein CVT24_011757 [Panaeolus cyanescens]|uniref:Uncharacterized protein n=1 Tax=Panaeolus cyanescens TaxID=181874 RepID=A0A409VYR5_9AGAR|nr:hypothetical protein CVT24_011757 [Panaeolus cyanescens]
MPRNPESLELHAKSRRWHPLKASISSKSTHKKIRPRELPKRLRQIPKVNLTNGFDTRLEPQVTQQTSATTDSYVLNPSPNDGEIDTAFRDLNLDIDGNGPFEFTISEEPHTYETTFSAPSILPDMTDCIVTNFHPELAPFLPSNGIDVDQVVDFNMLGDGLHPGFTHGHGEPFGRSFNLFPADYLRAEAPIRPLQPHSIDDQFLSNDRMCKEVFPLGYANIQLPEDILASFAPALDNHTVNDSGIGEIELGTVLLEGSFNPHFYAGEHNAQITSATWSQELEIVAALGWTRNRNFE